MPIRLKLHLFFAKLFGNKDQLCIYRLTDDDFWYHSPPDLMYGSYRVTDACAESAKQCGGNFWVNGDCSRYYLLFPNKHMLDQFTTMKALLGNDYAN